ncbi:hypothetical protein DVR12_07210 [Chitinophaga silvatica]|uniref:Uncharacterized protein n=1 Tax=Chitinophaga silvatica TaxID=2282649 RepID=A0A3E1YER4_9BACT|nr:hypothetical protein [Chitinophaga silvatica]RFS24969.1 hypothetical protein DVR12_07210 [Chitinophaga silvatica]
MKTYSYSKSYKYIGVGVLSIILVLLLTFIAFNFAEHKDSFITLPLFVPAGILVYSIDRLFFKITITPETFRYQTLFLFNSIYKIDELGGYKYAKSTIIIYPVGKRFTFINIPAFFKGSFELNGWIKSNVRSIEAVKKEQTKSKLMKLLPDKPLDEQLNKTWNNEIWWLYGGNILISVLAISVHSIIPWFSGILIFTVPVMLYILWKADGLISIYHLRSDPRPGFVLPLIIPVLSFIILNSGSSLMEIGNELRRPIIIGTIILVATVFIINRKKETVNAFTHLYFIVPYALLFGGYIAGSILYLNTTLPQKTIVYSSKIYRKYTGLTSKSAIVYYIEFEPWGEPPTNIGTTQSIGYSKYDRVQIGQPVTITYNTGGLNMPWFKVKY